MDLCDSNQRSRQADPAGPGSAPQAAENRALILVTPAAAPPAGTARYRQVAFLAQLLAIKNQHPQTRERRRATPREAVAAYRAAAALTEPL
jgi:hypothetical protein